MLWHFAISSINNRIQRFFCNLFFHSSDQFFNFIEFVMPVFFHAATRFSVSEFFLVESYRCPVLEPAFSPAMRVFHSTSDLPVALTSVLSFIFLTY